MEPQNRYVLYVDKKNAVDLASLPEFEIINTTEDLYDPEQDNCYVELELTPMAYGVGYYPTVQDVMEIANAKAIHEEATNAFFIDNFYIDEIYDRFNWDTGLSMFLGNMLSTADKMLLLQKEMVELYGCSYEPKDCKLEYPSKDGHIIKPLVGYTKDLFNDSASAIVTPAGSIPLWWPPLLSKYGFTVYIYTDKDEDLTTKEEQEYIRHFHDYDDYDEYWDYVERKGCY